MCCSSRPGRPALALSVSRLQSFVCFTRFRRLQNIIASPTDMPASSMSGMTPSELSRTQQTLALHRRAPRTSMMRRTRLEGRHFAVA